MKNPCKLVPGTILNANFNTRPFTTNENKPNVKNVIGREKNSITGLTIKFNNPKIIVSVMNRYIHFSLKQILYKVILRLLQ